MDEDCFEVWCAEMLRIAEEHARMRPALSVFADCLARVAKQRGFEDWLPMAVLDLLDRPNLSDLRGSLNLAVRNARGVTMRGCYDGGQQERELARQYRDLAARNGNGHPRVAAMLEGIANSYENEARRNDEQAELGERWHP